MAPGTWRRRAAGVVWAASLASTSWARAEVVVQLPVDAVLDGRPVATLSGGAFVAWSTGIDKDNGFITGAAAAALHQTGPALPDDGRFAASAEHPEIVLHFSNAAPVASPQAHRSTVVDTLLVPVPPATYRKLYLFLTSSYGDAPLSIKMVYADKTVTTTTFTLPDWGKRKALPTSPPIFFNLVSGLHKWNKAGASVDTPSHSITGVALTPAVERTLTAIEISKTTAAPYLTFWGATGIATSAPGPRGPEVGAAPARTSSPAGQRRH
jgi:hypothetical protein